MHSGHSMRITLENDLRRALESGDQFELHYQPIISFSQQRISGMEALIRWRRGNGERVSPEVFIPIAEQSRLILQIGRWVMEQACRDLARLPPPNEQTEAATAEGHDQQARRRLLLTQMAELERRTAQAAHAEKASRSAGPATSAS